MNHLPRFFGHRKEPKNTMDSKKIRRKPKLDRRNAVKNFDYEGGSEDVSSSGSVLYTRSMDFYDRTSFRVEGVEGEFDRICQSLGLSGPEDFSIPVAVWEAMRFRSSSDVLPRLKQIELEDAEKNEEIEVMGVELSDKFEDKVSIRDIGDCVQAETAETSGSSGGGIKGFRPPMLKPPPGIRISAMDNDSSTWDLLRDFAPQGEGGETENSVLNGDDNEVEEEKAKEEEEEKEECGKREEEENEARFVEIVEENEARFAEIVEELSVSGSCSFTTSHEDDSCSSSTGPRSNNISPNERFRRTITNWQKGDLLGRGSFGSVYEGISGDGFFFAVKEVSLLDQGSQGKQSVCQLEQEIALLSQFEHENIVQYYGTEMDESNLYIFIELVTKGSLASLYRRYNLGDSQVSYYTRQILHGLKYLHDRNVVHRDIKCANILVDANGSVKLADFGLAKATVKLNDIKSCKGTSFWMAPEVVKRKNQGYGLPADIWSLGCTVLEMLTGKIPYSHFEWMQALFRIGKGELPPVPDSLSRDARDFILQCLKVNPDDRPTAAQLLNHSFVQRPLSQSSGSASPYIPRRRV
ncbi:PREDICTED: mitogen-activated protein kinase kinase kinase 1 isoform X1 [Lupinus angustifolius]|uniref:mitogen-activated protein kinase kinase kinase 1 isoform X1 n=1 Tax=Lupinus angustifolius TaxID=3871 RepID=UPI00092FB37C|nr:PREDICTED: mitogen-activated protein kinase kinase kinase 1 isoform X1 [Lupinus angustifolius]